MMCTIDHPGCHSHAAIYSPGCEYFSRPTKAVSILDGSLFAVLAVDPVSLDVTFDDMPARALLGVAPDSVVGRNIADVVNHRWLDFIRRRVNEINDGDKKRVDEVALSHPHSGRNRLFKFQWIPIANLRDDGFTEIGIVVEDLTELSESRENYALLKVEAERNRISTELHDSLAQSLNGLLWQLRSLLFEVKGRPALEGYASSLQLIESLGTDLHREFRRAVWALDSDVLRGRSLPDALRNELGKVTGILDLGSSFDLKGEYRKLPSDVEQTAAKIFQEAVHNVIKHAACSSINVELDYDADCLRLAIEDNGRGFDLTTTASGGGFGLQNMHKRAEQIHGSVSVDSYPGHGTTVTVTVPTKRGSNGH